MPFLAVAYTEEDDNVNEFVLAQTNGMQQTRKGICHTEDGKLRPVTKLYVPSGHQKILPHLFGGIFVNLILLVCVSAVQFLNDLEFLPKSISDVTVDDPFDHFRLWIKNSGFLMYCIHMLVAGILQRCEKQVGFRPGRWNSFFFPNLRIGTVKAKFVYTERFQSSLPRKMKLVKVIPLYLVFLVFS